MLKKTLYFLSFALLFFVASASEKEKEVVEKKAEKPDYTREIVLSRILAIQLQHHHINNKNRKFNDEFSNDAFNLFIKRLDPQKRFLLKKEVKELEAYRYRIDDELKVNLRGGFDRLIREGYFQLPILSEKIMTRNLKMIKKDCDEILKKGFDYFKDEKIETDAEKLDFCTTYAELKDRWRKYLKYRCINSYLTFEREQEFRKKDEGDKKETAQSSGNTTKEKDKDRKILSVKELKEKARKKTQKSINLLFSRMQDSNIKDHFSRYYNSITMAFDPHTNYMDPETKEDFDIHMKKSLEGIGAVLQETEEGFTKVVRIVPGSASYRQGELKADDIILSVAQGDKPDVEVDITGMSVRDVVKYIRGPKGTTVILSVRKPTSKKIKTISIVRDIVNLKQRLAKSIILNSEESDRDFGYIWLPDFYRDFSDPVNGRSATKDVKKQLIELQKKGIDGLIFDLRNNGGGALEDARTISGLFIERGPIVKIMNSYRKIKVLHDRDREIVYDGPLVILVNQYSASASEIFAAAMQDYGRAVIIGTGHTHGKGTVQTIIDLDNVSPPDFSHYNFGDLKVTIQKFYRINGESTQYNGVVPDIHIPDDRSYLETGEKYLDHSLKWDMIPGEMNYVKWSKSDYDIDNLKDLSQKRVSKSPIFKFISQRDQRFLKKKDVSDISLNIKDLKIERDINHKENEEYKKILGLNDDKKEDKKDEIKDEKKDEKKDEEELSEEEIEQKELKESLDQDPYVKETLSILSDIISRKKS